MTTHSALAFASHVLNVTIVAVRRWSAGQIQDNLGITGDTLTWMLALVATTAASLQGVLAAYGRNTSDGL